MNRGVLVKIGFCLGALSLVLYRHIDEQNQITAMKIALPDRLKELKTIKEETTHLRYEIEQFESPQHLLSLAKKSEHSHLKYPLSKEIIAMHEGPALIEESDSGSQHRTSPSITIASHPPMQK